MSPQDEREAAVALEPLDADDDRAMRMLRTHWERTDPVPAGLAERVKFAMSMATMEAEVAYLISEGASVGSVRKTEYDRATTVTFESAGLSIMVALEDTDRGRTTVRGWVTSPSAEVELRQRGRSTTTTADEEGRFTFDSVERGSVQLFIQRTGEPGSRPVITPGFEI